MLLFASFLFLAGCGSNDSEEPAEENTEPTEGTEEDASDESVEDKEGTGSEADSETDTEGTDSEGIHRKRNQLRKLKIVQEKTEQMKIQTEMMKPRLKRKSQNLRVRTKQKKMIHQTVHLQKQTRHLLTLRK